MNPQDDRTVGERSEGGVIVNGVKSFSSGAPDSDMLVISWRDAQTGDLYKGMVPTRRPGV
ncbi:hypothetical protein ACOALA_17075 [Alicyclobacillus acidoterrestris]|uniref:hypothetical protein n=1 Tax=Alicyclobacillus acidoterrestris TaxID=1450 RepID=UPI003F52BE91